MKNQFLLFVIIVLSATSIKAQLNGYGTSTAPYLINSLTDLKYFRDQINANNTTFDKSGVYFKLTSNIDLSAETSSWIPIGQSASVSFVGNFDGGGYTISGIKIGTATRPSTLTIAGLFGICSTGSISNINIDNMYINITSNSTSDIAIGVLTGNATTNCKIANCSINGSITVSYTGIGNAFIGGLSAKLEANSDIINSCTNVTINGTTSYTGTINLKQLTAGGLVGNISTAGGSLPRVRNSFALGKITASASNDAMVLAGGLAGSNGGQIYNCYASGNILVNTKNGTAKVGGLCGTVPVGSTIGQSFALNDLLRAISPSGIRMVNRIAEVLGSSFGNSATTSLKLQSATSDATINAAIYTIQFDPKGGITTAPAQTVAYGTTLTMPNTPLKGDSLFCGWYSPDNISYDANTPVTKSLTLTARYWLSPKQYIALSSSDTRYNAQIIRDNFGTPFGKSVAVATQPLFRIFERDVNSTFVPSLKKHLSDALQYDIPIMIFLSEYPINNVRPDLYNWWDSTKTGYNPANINNVEWSGWDSTTAVKIGWFNWGSQLRTTPMPNLMSPTFQQAERDAITTLMTIVKQWYDSLPVNKKYLFAGIRSTDEVAIGVNNWYYPNGNSYLNQPAANDPTTGIDATILPSRGVQTIGYNAVKTAGIRSSGTLTIDDLNEVCRRHCEFLSKIYYDLGFPREKIFASSFAKTVGEAQICVNNYSCPSWSFYNGSATNPTSFTAAMQVISTSTAPGWCMAEWGFGSTDPNAWSDALTKGLSLAGNKLIRITGNRVIDGNGGIIKPAADGVNMVLSVNTISDKQQGATADMNNLLSALNGYVADTNNTLPAGFTWLDWEVVPGLNNSYPVLKNLNLFTGLNSPLNNNLDIKCISETGKLIIKSSNELKEIKVYDLVGNRVSSAKILGQTVEISLTKGIYIIPGYGKILIK